MRGIYITLLIMSLRFFNVELSFSQTYSTTSKSCGKCGKSVNSYSKVGDNCPFCGITWGKENTHITTNNISGKNSSEYFNQILVNPNSKSFSKKRHIKDVIEIDNSKASKAETEKWILEKLNTNTPKKYFIRNDDNPYEIDGPFSRKGTGIYFMNYYYSFDNYNLIIEYEKDFLGIKKHKIKIPIYDIGRIYDYKSTLWIGTRKETIIDYEITENTKSVTDIFYTQFNVSAETDLCERIHKAFLHLKKFYKKPQSTEAF